MPPTGRLLRIIEVHPPKDGGRLTVMHRTRTFDGVVAIEGEIVLVLDDREAVLRSGGAAVQRAASHAWENRSDSLPDGPGTRPEPSARDQGAAGSRSKGLANRSRMSGSSALAVPAARAARWAREEVM